VTGVEISTLWENHEIHIVGLNIDIAHPALTALLEEQKARRQLRAQMIAERLEKARIPGAWEGAMKLADGGAVTRGHFARFLVDAGMPAISPTFLKIPRPRENRIRSAAVVYNKTSD
jgi:predicted metal-dependent phosphoesterase TrpH